jgi:hypothetical protein
MSNALAGVLVAISHRAPVAKYFELEMMPWLWQTISSTIATLILPYLPDEQSS